MGITDEGSVFKHGGADFDLERLSVQHVVELRNTPPARLGVLIQEAFENDNAPFAHFAQAVLALSAVEPMTQSDIIGRWDTTRQTPVAHQIERRRQQIGILAQFFPDFGLLQCLVEPREPEAEMRYNNVDQSAH